MRFVLAFSAMLLLGAGCTAPVPSSSDSAVPVTSAERIDLSGRGLEDISRDIFERKGVEELDVSNNRLTGSLPAEIRHLSSLKVLNTSGNRMTGVPAEVGQLSHLEVLDLSNNLLTGLPHEIGNLKNLRTLNLEGNDISSFDLEIIRKALPRAAILVDEAR